MGGTGEEKEYEAGGSEERKASTIRKGNRRTEKGPRLVGDRGEGRGSTWYIDCFKEPRKGELVGAKI